MPKDQPDLPDHIEESIRAITKLHTDHHSQTGPVQRGVETLTGWIGRPNFIVLLSLAILLWIAANLASPWLGIRAWDPPPFNWLQGAIGLLALYAALMILVTQRRADELGSQREQLTLQLAILSERKSAKIIALLEEVRRDSATLPDRIDDQATAMAIAMDPHTVLTAIKEGTDPAGISPATGR